jgi:hypothetical protein
MSYRPLSARGKTGTSFDVLHEGIPAWLLEPVCAWLRPFIRTYTTTGSVHYFTDWMRNLQTRMHLDPPLPWAHHIRDVANSLEQRVGWDGGELGLDILDYTLHHLSEALPYSQQEKAQELGAVLLAGGSAWEVTSVEGGDYALTRRALGPVRDAIEQILPAAERAGGHLSTAWRFLAGRDPIPDQAYFQALMAVEAAAKPVVSPNDSNATLGKMLRAIKDAPHKFRFALGDPSAVVPVMEAMWTTHVRHGTDDREAPMGMSPEEADAAVYLALTLVRWFAGGTVTRS